MSILEVVGWGVVTLLSINGALDLYMAYRFARHHGTDYTAAGFNWIALKWLLIHHLDELVRRVPFLGQDLSETVLYNQKDDDETS